jgi:hypothetical protein
MTAFSVMRRLEQTARGEGVHRIRDILGMPFRGRHITNFVNGNPLVDGIPLFDARILWQIKQQGLRISKGPVNAKYGDGAYCFVGKAKPPSAGHFYVDVEIPAKIGVEQIEIPGISYYYYRFLPAEGDVIPGVKIVGTNLPMDALDLAREFMKG